MRASTSHAALACLTAAAAWHVTPTAEACGGFFCSQTPVDQSAERVVFTVQEDHTEMVVQITYQGDDDSFAWLLPLVDVPDPESLATVPTGALTALDTATEPTFRRDPECQQYFLFDDFLSLASSAGAPPSAQEDGDVNVFFEQEVGPYVAVALSSEDPAATAKWLRDNDYNIADSMDPYIKLYTSEGMKFLALKLNADSDVSDIAPFKLDLPGTSPGIPLRLTTIAAEPEMGVKVWVFADQRFEPANAMELEIDEADLRWDPQTWAPETNWNALVARAVDKEMGRAWVAEMAGDVSELRQAIETSPVNGPEQQEAQEALLTMIGESSYMTRLYTRLAPEEMTYDPVFSRSSAGDVDRMRQLPYIDELCAEMDDVPMPSPCDFAACGALGICREVTDPATENLVAACGCAPGATARTTFEPNGTTPAVSCQDQRLSFINPGDQLRDDAQRLPDPCVGFDCGEHGECVSMNLTPTCECEQGYVARGYLDDGGARQTTCIRPAKAIPEMFYEMRPEERPDELPVGRDVDIAAPVTDMDNMQVADMVDAIEAGEMPDPGSPQNLPSAKGSGGCSASSAGGPALGLWTLLLGAAALGWRRRARA